eukprot:TRINITY_DN26125_c0_g1_i1.p1 TRINITY_DN26125_c0_g1~~TRINITY_DN26125_c0_g1_i1.p1  ORF type:complete len:351 (+),score=49.11 TRINITY_DN26125_c0_g1_i1:34-1086(+)
MLGHSGSLSICARLVDGTLIELEVEDCSASTISTLHQSVAAKLSVHEEQVELFLETLQLEDGEQRLDTLCESPGHHLELTVVKRPCRAPPSSYDIYAKEGVQDFVHETDINMQLGADDCNEEVFAWVKAEKITWPEPKDININMMPFRMGDISSVPEEYQHYWPLLLACELPNSELGRIGYLSIHESWVEQGTSQRRPGLHVESSNIMLEEGGKFVPTIASWGNAFGCREAGGIYMGSNVSQSCQIWNWKITDPEMLLGPLGCIEHLRETLGDGIHMQAGEIWWLTDLTPHESLPLAERQYRQYFRLVTSSVGIWYEKHSTRNRLGIEPDPEITKIEKVDKFVEAGIASP